MRAITSRFDYTAPDSHLSAGFAKDSWFSFTICLHEPQQNCSKGICAVILEYRLYNERPALNMVGRCFFQRIFTCDTFFAFRQFIILHSNPFQSFVKIEKEAKRTAAGHRRHFLRSQLHGSLTPAHADGCGAQCFVGVQCASIFNPVRVSSPASRHACFTIWCCSLARYSGPVLRT